MLPFWPKCRLGHPKNYLFSLSTRIFSGSKYPTNISFIFKQEALILRLVHVVQTRTKQFTLLAHVLKDLKEGMQDEALLEIGTDEGGGAKMDTDDS